MQKSQSQLKSNEPLNSMCICQKLLYPTKVCESQELSDVQTVRIFEGNILLSTLSKENFSNAALFRQIRSKSLPRVFSKGYSMSDATKRIQNLRLIKKIRRFTNIDPIFIVQISSTEAQIFLYLLLL